MDVGQLAPHQSDIARIDHGRPAFEEFEHHQGSRPVRRGNLPPQGAVPPGDGRRDGRTLPGQMAQKPGFIGHVSLTSGPSPAQPGHMEPTVARTQAVDIVEPPADQGAGQVRAQVVAGGQASP